VKESPKMLPNTFWDKFNVLPTLTLEKSSPAIWASFVIYTKETARNKHSPNWEKFAQLGKIRPIGKNSPNWEKFAQLDENSPNLVTLLLRKAKLANVQNKNRRKF
jgi:hypothetical protein